MYEIDVLATSVWHVAPITVGDLHWHVFCDTQVPFPLQTEGSVLDTPPQSIGDPVVLGATVVFTALVVVGDAVLVPGGVCVVVFPDVVGVIVLVVPEDCVVDGLVVVVGTAVVVPA